jgi:hypothetical protein
MAASPSCMRQRSHAVVQTCDVVAAGEYPSTENSGAMQVCHCMYKLSIHTCTVNMPNASFPRILEVTDVVDHPCAGSIIFTSLHFTSLVSDAECINETYCPFLATFDSFCWAARSWGSVGV